VPVLKELLPAKTCAGSKLRNTGTLAYSFFFSSTSDLMPSTM
jgi:hypothetical protein